MELFYGLIGLVLAIIMLFFIELSSIDVTERLFPKNYHARYSYQRLMNMLDEISDYKHYPVPYLNEMEELLTEISSYLSKKKLKDQKYRLQMEFVLHRYNHKISNIREEFLGFKGLIADESKGLEESVQFCLTNLDVVLKELKTACEKNESINLSK